MPYRYTQLYEGYYHIYNRGNEKKNIFHAPGDYIFFIQRLDQYRKKFRLAIICYCLMPNHFHLCVRKEDESGDIPSFMRNVQMVYSKYLNNKYEKVGHSFQGRYKVKAVTKEEQFLYLTAYIHANPKTAGLVSNLRDWQWSSFLDYIAVRAGKIPESAMVLSYFKSSLEYEKWVDSIGEEKYEKKLSGLKLE